MSPLGKRLRISTLFLVGLGIIILGFPKTRAAHAGTATDVALAAGCAAAGVALETGMLTTQVSVDPHQLDFYSIAGDPPPDPQPFAVQCYDYGDFGGECGGTISVNQPWLFTDRGDFFGTDVVGVFVDTTGLEPGVYEGNIHVQYDFVSVDDEESISVELVIDPPPEGS